MVSQSGENAMNTGDPHIPSFRPTHDFDLGLGVFSNAQRIIDARYECGVTLSKPLRVGLCWRVGIPLGVPQLGSMC
jgi:hypothetical protein